MCDIVVATRGSEIGSMAKVGQLVPTSNFDQRFGHHRVGPNHVRWTADHSLQHEKVEDAQVAINTKHFVSMLGQSLLRKFHLKRMQLEAVGRFKLLGSILGSRPPAPPL